MLILSLLIVLCVVIALSYYENREYFANPTIGNTVKCTVNPPGSKSADTLFQLAKNNKLNFYTDLNAAKEWDPLGVNTPQIIDDCKAYTLGTEMKAPGPGTKYGITVQCATNPPGDKPVDTYFQYSINQTLIPYLNKETADRFAPGYDTMGKPIVPFIISDCSGFSVGNLISSNTATSNTAVGAPSGQQGSYGTLNTPDAQIGTATGKVYNPLTAFQYNNAVGAPSGQQDAQIGSGSQITNMQPSNWINQLGPLLSASGSAQSAQVLSAPAQPIRNDVNPQVSVSSTGYNAMELQNQSSLLSNIKKIVQDELRTSRVQPENHPLALTGTNGSCSNSTQQGNEYMNGKEDMSKYIKKDSIPCWGCNLDY